ncbi:hypothetical protein [Streptomyces decoyicus]|nr:hypothetical protein [Streptomyces decoyicus]QZY18051.1 hypothetical protein K7C20_24720 [Streptomyces decoyicus]
METKHFEEVARVLARLEKGARPEFIDGKMRFTSPTPSASPSKPSS